MEVLLKLLFSFFKIGLFSFGGGYAMLPFMQREIINNNEWLTNGEFVDIIGISQMTPGPVSVNSATFVGFKVYGIIGSIFATLGITLVSFLLVSIVYKAMNKFKESKVLKSAMLGMRPILVALILNAFISLARDAYMDVKSVFVTLIIGGCLITKKVHPILTIALAGVLGIILWR